MSLTLLDRGPLSEAVEADGDDFETLFWRGNGGFPRAATGLPLGEMAR